MRKAFFVFLSIISIAAFSSCGGSSDSDEKKKSVKYENQDFGYSVVLPVGFGSSTEEMYEKERGGKLFLGNDCQIDFTARKMDYLGGTTPEASSKQCFELQKGVYSDAEGEMIDSVTYLVKGSDDFGLRANFQTQKNGNKYMIDFTYPKDKKAQFGKDVDAVIDSFKTK